MDYIKEAKKTDLPDAEYSKIVLSYSNYTSPVDQVRVLQLFHAIMGVSTETGEIVDLVKKMIFYEKTVDKENFKEEIGDLFWYIALLCDILGVSFEEIQKKNIEKLKKRYGDKFSKKAALERKDKKGGSHE